MATLTIPESARAYFPKTIDPSKLWVHYHSETDSLVVYFAGEPVPTVWEDVDLFAYIGFAINDETTVTGLMIENFSKWLLVSNIVEAEFVSASI